MRIFGNVIKRIRPVGIKFYVFSLFSSLVLLLLSMLVINSWSVSAQQAEEATPSATLQVPNYSKLAIDPAEIPTAAEEADYSIDAKEEFFASRLIVKYKAGVSDEVKRSIAKSLSAKYVREDLDLLGAKVLRVDPQMRDSVFESLKNNPNIEYVEKEAVLRKSENILPPDCGSPNDPLYCSGDQWGLGAINATAGWRLNRGSPSVTVAVVDTGVDYNHADIGNRVIKGYNLTVSPSSPDYGNPMDNDGHGTFIAGIIGASTDNARNMAGVNWYSKVLAVKVSEAGAAAPEVLGSGINVAANQFPDLNVKVINVSFGGAGGPTMKAAVENAQNKGIVVVAAAQHPPGSSDGNCFINFPAAYNGVISVVGVNSANQRVSGCTQKSSGGVNYQGIQLSAPGDNLHSLNNGGGTSYEPGGATSYAAPFVSGVASILASCSGSVAQDLKNGAVDIGSNGYDANTGYGKVNLWKALVQNCYPIPGDVDCNSTVNAIDALYILRYVVQLASAANSCPVNVSHEIYFPQADVNGDGHVDAIDALFVLQYVAGVRNLQSQSLIGGAVDNDNDGMTDGQEAQYSCLNPNVSDADYDFDSDSLSNAGDLVLGTNPCVADTDGDGFSDYAEFWVGTDPVLRCGENAWPADLVSGGIPDSTNRVNIMDLTSFLAPARHINTSPGDVGYDRRWDLVPGKGAFSKDINISDLTALLVLAPPMLNGQRAFNGPACTP